MWDGVAREAEDIPEGAPRPAHTSSLIFSSSGAAAGAGGQGRTGAGLGRGRAEAVAVYLEVSTKKRLEGGEG